MRVVLAKWGNSAALRLPKAVVEALHLKLGSELQLEFDQQSIRFRPVLSRKRLTLEEMAQAAQRIGAQNEPESVVWGPDMGAEILHDDGAV